VIRLITGLNKCESCKQKFKENRILTVTSLYVSEVLCFIKRYKGSLKQNYMLHEHNTRSKYDFRTESCNTSLYQKSVINMGIMLYKFLPKEIKKWIILIVLKKSKINFIEGIFVYARRILKH
jgi:hypothetical protein